MTPRRSSLLLLAIAYVAFVSLGLPDAMIGVSWPSVREAFGAPLSGLGAVLFATGAGYFVSGLVAGRLTNALGVGLLLAASTALVAAGVFGYVAAPGFGLFLAFAFLIGLGSGAIDAGLNTYAAASFSAKHVNWLHACYSLGAALGPVVMTAVLVRGASWRWGYGLVGAALCAMALVFLSTRGSWRSEGAHPDAAPAVEPVSTSAALKRPLVWLQVGVFFTYTGLEITVGQWSYSVFRDLYGLSTQTAGTWTGLYWGSILAGRVLIGFVVERVGPERLLRAATAVALLGSVLFWLGGPLAGLAGLILVGFSLAPIFPTLMSLTPARLGPGVAAHAVGFQVSAAMLGSAVGPSVAGLLAARFGLGAVGVVAVVAALALWILHESVVLAGRRPASAS